VLLAATWTAYAIPPVRGEVTEITGSSSASVVEVVGTSTVQSDFGQVNVPLTAQNPPATSRAQLDRVGPDGQTTAAGQAVALFVQPDLGALGPPNDVGLDLGAFSDDAFTGWIVQGTANETRTIVTSGNNLGGNLIVGPVISSRGRVVLSGALIITASDLAKDLSGVEAGLKVRVVMRRAGEAATMLLDGEVTVSGGPNGAVTVSQATGAFAGMFLPVIDFANAVPDLPLVKALLFIGMNLPYNYDTGAGGEFDLDLSVSSRLVSTPGGTGAAAVFGLPQDGFGSVLQRIKKDDRGRQLEALIAQHVDTTGAAYAGGESAVGSAATNLFPLCGAVGPGATGLLLAGCFLIVAGRRRRRRAAPRTM